MRFGNRYAPPQPGIRPRNTSGNEKAAAPEEIERYWQCSATSTPPPMAAPLTNANVGTEDEPSMPSTSWPSRPMARAWPRSVRRGTPVRSAPTAKMNGLPVTQIAARPGMACASTMAALSSSSPPGPKVFGLVWSKPLSSVMIAAVPAPSGRSTVRSFEWVTTSSANWIDSSSAASASDCGIGLEMLSVTAQASCL